ncbi:Kinesin-like protein KIF17 (KIF3-related motor protein) [Durusdinium trenchii]|uniref:Kinesin-like protein n=1 Tax=Durusdinium trenchii TaxID=1381693 RepID=A0ABP0IDH8_9DINO
MIQRLKDEVQEQGTPLQTAVLASYLEIYQEKMYDLLVNTRADLQVRLHPTLGPHVPGLIQSPVTTSEEVHELLDFGAKNRAVGATSMNANSSRSHAVFTLDIRLSYSGEAAKDLQSRIHFVDLAGSEKQKKTNATGERLQEGIAINQSLSSLSRVIQALSGSSGIQPVFRESKLTMLLKEALSGNSRTVLLACISPSRSNHEETISTLEFAARCKLIKTNATKNEQDKRELLETLSKDKQEIERRLEEERQRNKLLLQEMERRIAEAKRDQELARQMQEEKREIEEKLQAYLKGEHERGKEQQVEVAQQLKGKNEAERESPADAAKEAPRESPGTDAEQVEKKEPQEGPPESLASAAEKVEQTERQALQESPPDGEKVRDPEDKMLQESQERENLAQSELEELKASQQKELEQLQQTKASSPG